MRSHTPSRKALGTLIEFEGGEYALKREYGGRCSRCDPVGPDGRCPLLSSQGYTACAGTYVYKKEWILCMRILKRSRRHAMQKICEDEGRYYRAVEMNWDAERLEHVCTGCVFKDPDEDFGAQYSCLQPGFPTKAKAAGLPDCSDDVTIVYEEIDPLYADFLKVKEAEDGSHRKTR